MPLDIVWEPHQQDLTSSLEPVQHHFATGRIFWGLTLRVRVRVRATTSTSGLVAKLQTMKDRKAVAIPISHIIYMCVCVLCECNIYTATSVLVDLILCEGILRTSYYYCTRSEKSIILVPYFYQQYVQHKKCRTDGTLHDNSLVSFRFKVCCDYSFCTQQIYVSDPKTPSHLIFFYLLFAICGDYDVSWCVNTNFLQKLVVFNGTWDGIGPYTFQVLFSPQQLVGDGSIIPTIFMISF